LIYVHARIPIAADSKRVCTTVDYVYARTLLLLQTVNKVDYKYARVPDSSNC
jgi:hypothetical protein